MDVVSLPTDVLCYVTRYLDFWDLFQFVSSTKQLSFLFDDNSWNKIAWDTNSNEMSDIKQNIQRSTLVNSLKDGRFSSACLKHNIFTNRNINESPITPDLTQSQILNLLKIALNILRENKGKNIKKLAEIGLPEILENTILGHVGNVSKNSIMWPWLVRLFSYYCYQSNRIYKKNERTFAILLQRSWNDSSLISSCMANVGLDQTDHPITLELSENLPIGTYEWRGFYFYLTDMFSLDPQMVMRLTIARWDGDLTSKISPTKEQNIDEAYGFVNRIHLHTFAGDEIFSIHGEGKDMRSFSVQGKAIKRAETGKIEVLMGKQYDNGTFWCYIGGTTDFGIAGTWGAPNWGGPFLLWTEGKKVERDGFSFEGKALPNKPSSSWLDSIIPPSYGMNPYWQEEEEEEDDGDDDDGYENEDENEQQED
eukprot:TRINITY_DN4393_c0_g1_i2.p1 TRINITY_DN4393_c0_g1~~TRINITY_DN4393_c0_g1_i2.p1  ORF type:complete len:437 (-),score=82.48 TRINITY_DN4393_c0_g1_i2:31-1299(-)